MLKIFEYGKISDDLKSEILDIINLVLSKSDRKTPYIEVLLFEKLNDLKDFIYREASELGLHQSAIQNIYFAMHDAYRGWPRILICLELLNKLPNEVWRGGIQHEVGHAILHGSLEYYLFSLPKNLADLCYKFNMESFQCFNLLYFISVAVKDYEVSKYLIKLNFTRDQYPFIKYNLHLDEEEIMYWNILADEASRIIYTFLIYKTISASIPFLEIDEYRESINELIEDMIEILDDRYRSLIYLLINMFRDFDIDTRNNIYHVANELSKLLEEAGIT